MTRDAPHPTRVTIRPAVVADAPALAALAVAFLRHEGRLETGHLTPGTMAEWLRGPRPAFEALLAEVAGQARGYLAFYQAFSLFRGHPVFLVENLYVDAAARGQGIGRHLMVAAAAEARRRALGRIELNVRAHGQGAIRFYEGLGARAAGEAVYRIEDEALAALAAGAP